uniref:Transmembrane protein 53 n=1 Tax=Anser brachyrhynchus TaxID=132585 RepID=A0A8B9CK54_9AVES
PRAGQRRGDVELPLDPCTARTHGGAEAGRQPVVILLGWAGCQDRYLAKYSAIYSQRGCTVIRYTAPWRMVFFSESFGIRSLRTPARRLLELLFDHSIDNRPVLFHVFSNGGVMLYRYILEALHTQQPFKNLRVLGTIFDSAPGRRNLRGSLRVFCMVSCLLLSPLLVEGISVGGKTDELVTEHLITEMKQSQRVTVSEAEDPTESVSCHFLEREKTNTTHLCLAGRPPSGQHNSKIWG